MGTAKESACEEWRWARVSKGWAWTLFVQYWSLRKVGFGINFLSRLADGSFAFIVAVSTGKGRDAAVPPHSGRGYCAPHLILAVMIPKAAASTSPSIIDHSVLIDAFLRCCWWVLIFWFLVSPLPEIKFRTIRTNRTHPPTYKSWMQSKPAECHKMSDPGRFRQGRKQGCSAPGHHMCFCFPSARGYEFVCTESGIYLPPRALLHLHKVLTFSYQHQMR